MTILPIVDRELRVSARNKATHCWRLIFAISAVVIVGAMALISAAARNTFSAELGLWTYNILKWLAFGLTFASGVFLTADALSEEKREGTLGLLFLTDLRGIDVVLGKLLATSLRTFYSLLAIFPIMAFCFCLGGVTREDFQQTFIALCNTLFFSLALGMAISVISRDAHKAMTAAVVALTALVVLIPEPIKIISPFYAFTNADSYRPPYFWTSILMVHLEGWCFLALASWLAPKTWQEKGIRGSVKAIWQWPLPGLQTSREKERELRDKNPVCWIISRDRWAANLARIAFVLVLVAFVLSLILVLNPRQHAVAPAVTRSIVTKTTHSTTYFVTSNKPMLVQSHWYRIVSFFTGVLPLAIDFWLAAQICRFYVEGKKSGFLELLWVTPIKPLDIVNSHWLALRRIFLLPIAMQIFLSLITGAINIWIEPAMGTPPALGREREVGQTLSLILGTVNWAAGLCTIAWYSIWMGLNSKKINVAMLKTFLYAKVLPWFGVLFILGIISVMITFGGGGASLFWLGQAAFQGFFIVANLALIFYASTEAKALAGEWPKSAGA